ncbi:SGNH/GDSL hydrolase family protein [Sporomusa carbonis]|uniref:SGNH/GDSL hydrolase family protein n=1 Tax=Sporomusa carbonis TaxID=3076075 RepID=UPI003C7B616A
MNKPESMNDKTHFESVTLLKEVYNPGVELDTTLFTGQGSIWWQVRALNLDREPISRFTDPKKLEEGEFDPVSPFITTHLDKLARVPLYPAYSWIPVLNADSYEVQILSGPVQSSTNSLPGNLKKSYIIKGADSFDCYDVDAFTEEGVYWWRVIALDAKGQPIGQWSKPQPFTVSREGNIIAALGDSVTHGGGAISNPPGIPAYDWTSYAGFSIKNLGRSGDTTGSMLARFDHNVIPFQPKVLVVMGGLNDIRAGTRAVEVINHLTKIKEKCQENKIIPVFLTLTPVNPINIKRVFNEDTSPNWQEEWYKVNKWVREQTYYVDIAPMLMDNDGVMPTEFATDGLHPDTKGKALIGYAVGDYLRKNFGDVINK